MGRVIRDRVREILKDFKDEVVSADYISDELDVPVEAVQTCIRNMMRDKVIDIEVITRGREWRYVSDTPSNEPHRDYPYSTKVLILTNAKGKLVFDMEGILYVAKPLEF